jgi:nicotinamidase/pyrazinamidase
LRQDGAFDGEACVVFGVATDYCVRACALGLAAAGARVQVLEDAIRGVAADTTAQTVEEMRNAGVEFTTTSEVLNRLAESSSAD